MRLITYLLLGLFAIVVIGLSVANRQYVDVHLAPDFSAYGVEKAPDLSVPLYLVALLCAALGFILGTLREYMRESRIRKRSAERRRELGRLQQEVDSLKSRANLDEDDEIIALTSR
jgi:hypothetical protein